MADYRETGHLNPVVYRIYPAGEISSPPSKFPPSNLLDLITYTRAHPEIRSLAGGMPASELHPREDVAEAITEIFRNPNISADEIFQYGDAQGNLRYRELIAQNLTQLTKINILAEYIVTTVGGQGAISEFLETTFKANNPNKKVLITRPDTYSAAKGAAHRLGIPMVAVQSDMEGILPDKLEEMFRLLKSNYQIEPGGVYEMVVSNPTGGIMSDQRGIDISIVCNRHGVKSLFDYAYQGIIFDQLVSEPKLPYLAIKGVSACFSSSKIIAPGLRTTHLLTLDSELMDQYVGNKRDNIIFTPPLNELILWQLFNTPGWLDKRRNIVRERYNQGMRAAIEAIENNSDVLQLPFTPQGGMFLYPDMPEGFSSHLMLDRMLTEARIAYVPGPWTQIPQLQMIDGELLGPEMRDNCFRLCDTTLPAEELKATINDMAKELRTIAKEEKIPLFT